MGNVLDNLKEREKQFRDALFWGRIMFLRGLGISVIPYKELKKKIAEVIYKLYNYFLHILKIKQEFICKKYRNATTKNNNISMKVVTCFEYANLRDYVTNLDKIFLYKQFLFKNMKIYIPDGYECYLTKIYGNYWQFPLLEERKNSVSYGGMDE
ncbi:MAG: LicD family protein [Bacilli bacterium]